MTATEQSLLRRIEELEVREAALIKAIEVALDALKCNHRKPTKASNPSGVTKPSAHWMEIGSQPGKLKDVAAMYCVSPTTVFRYRQRVDNEAIAARVAKQNDTQNLKRRYHCR